MLSKRGQVTILVIVGIILLFSVSLILSLQSYIVNKQLDAQANQNINTFLQVNAINYYVTSCLNRVASQGLETLTEQGGYIYDYQGGLINTSKFQEGINYLPFNITYTTTDRSGNKINRTKTINVSYVITNTFFCPAYYLPKPINYSNENTSFYPAKRLSFDQFQSRFSHSYTSALPGCNGLSPRIYPMSGFLGKNNLPKLYSMNGSNKLASSWAGNYNYFELPGEKTSIQRQLEYYIKSNLRKCVDFDYFTKNLTAYNITVDQNKTVIKTVLQNPKGIEVKAEFPFTVSVGGKKPIVKQVSFETRLNVNIKQIYSFIYNIIYQAVKKPDFNYLKSYPLFRNYISAYHFQLIRNACGLNCNSSNDLNDDILKITDDSSRLNGKPLTFYFAIKQRKPILNYSHDKTQHSYFKGQPIDYLFFVNSTITFNPEAIDPDFDNITYNYSGWKETFDQEFNYTCCEEKHCTFSNHTMCIINLSDKPHNWTRSQEFITTKRSARYKTNSSDVGYHEVFITVTDQHGAKDYQKIRLIVFDLPEAILQGRNLFSDVNNNYTSIEDEYILDASKSRTSNLMGGNLSQLIFFDAEKPYEQNNNYNFYYNVSTKNSKEIIMPLEQHSFSNITLLPYSNKTLNFPIPQNLTVRHPQLIVAQKANGNTIYSAPTKGTVYLSECLIHGYDNKTRSYPSPDLSNFQNIYHWSIPGNTFNNLSYAPHVCCKPLNPDQNASENGAGTRYVSSHTCLDFNFRTCYPFSDTYVFMNQSLIDMNISDVEFVNKENYNSKFGNGMFSNSFFGNLKSLSENKKDLYNDIFTVNFEQSCSGLRGDTCGGKVTTNWKDKSCNDLGQVSGQFARCQGPSESYDACVGKGASDLTCLNYQPGQSWEKDWLQYKNSELFEELTGKNKDAIEKGFCAPAKKVSVIESISENGLSYFKVEENPQSNLVCEASCNGEGSCEYDLNKDCECDSSDRNNICNGVKAEQLFEWSNMNKNDIFSRPLKKRFVCVTKGDETVACDDSCQPIEQSELSCWCRLNHNNHHNTLGNDNNNLNSWPGIAEGDIKGHLEQFFNKIYYKSKISGDFCCVDDNIIVKKNPLFSLPSIGLRHPKTCYEGKIYPNKRISNSLLSCDGNLLYCKDDNTEQNEDSNLFIIYSPNENAGAIQSQNIGINTCGYTCSYSEDDEAEWIKSSGHLTEEY